jgi:peptide/nickel transport system substrate-binding protein
MLAGCSIGDDQTGSARVGGSIAVGTSAAPQSLDPALATDLDTLGALWLVYTPLLSYRHAEGKNGTDLVPGLARALPLVSDDGLVYTLHLRRGVRYSDGSPVRAGDFERAIDRLRSLRSPLAPLYAGISSIDADARSGTIRITFSRPDPTFANVLALPSSAPLPRGTPSRDLSSTPPPGVGAFRVGAVQDGGRVVLIRRRDFRLPGISAAHVDRVVLERPEPASRQAADIVSGRRDVMREAAPVELLPEIRAKYQDRYREDPDVSSVLLVIRPNAPPFDDPAVRRAVGNSLDTEKLVRLYEGFLEPSCNVLPTAVSGYRQVESCPRGDLDEKPDLIAAQKQIDDAGATMARVSVRTEAKVPPGVARYVARALRSVGLDAHVNGRAGARLRVVRISPLVPHPAKFLEPFTRIAFDPQLNETVDQATASASEPEQADEFWASADEGVVDEAYAVPLGSERRPTFLSERLDAENCASVHPLFGLDFSSLCLK